MTDGIHVAVQQRGVITLPAEIRRRLQLDVPGAQVRVVLRDDGVVELHPELPIAAEQVWFWTERWQRREREADEDVAAGRVTTYADVEDLIADLDR